jgi:hypothetical protein
MADNTVAYGFVGLQHLYSTRVSEVGVDRIYTAIEESAMEHTRQINALMSSFVERTTMAKEQIELAGGGTLQPLDEWGNPKPTKPSGSYNVGYPIQGGGDAWGDNRVTRALMTVEEANGFTLEAMRKDADWLRRHMLAAVLDNVAWTFNDKVGGAGAKGLGDITIQPLAITSDGVTYVKIGGDVETDQHYLAQAAAIDDSNNPFDDIYDELIEHPSNSGPVVVYVSTSLKTSIMNLTAFIEVGDPDLRYGIGATRIAGEPGMFDENIRGFGDEVLGKVNKCWIVEWKALPSGYMIGHARGGGPVLKMREYASPDLQGFFMERHSPDGNLMETRMIRYAGFGVANRVAAVAYYVGGGAYAIPSGYGAPLAV